MTKLLVTGGTGYIGSHAVHSLIEAGYEVIILDDLSNSKQKYAHKDATFIKGSILDKELLDQIFTENDIDGVLHFAAKISVPDSVIKPAIYHSTNTDGTNNLVEAMKKHGVDKIVFSSTAATYGTPEKVPVTEQTETKPINPYGVSKLNAEDIIITSGLRFVIFRYFNVAGVNLEVGLRYDPLKEATHLIPVVNEAALGIRPALQIYGTDYKTKDGTAVRDYVHVQDLVDAHVLGYGELEKGTESSIFNLSSGSGFSVREVWEEAEKILNQKIPFVNRSRRVGDPEELTADNTKAVEVLKWNNKYSLGEMIKTDYISRKEDSSKEENPVISFVIPLYGKPNDILEDLIVKINNLKFDGVEFIICYKNSQEFNYDWLKKEANDKIKIIGPVKAEAQRTFKIIEASKHAKGNWIQIMDAHHDFYKNVLQQKIKLMKENIYSEFDLLVSSQKIIKRKASGEEFTIWTTHPRTTMGIWNGTTLFKKALFDKWGDEIARDINISIGDDRTYPIVFFAKETNLKIYYFPKNNYYKQMVYELNGVNTTSHSGWNTDLYKSFKILVDYVAVNTTRKSYLRYIGFYFIFMNSFAFYNYTWKGKRAGNETRKIIWNSRLPKRVKWPMMVTPWYLISLPYSIKRYKIRKRLKKNKTKFVKNK